MIVSALPNDQRVGGYRIIACLDRDYAGFYYRANEIETGQTVVLFESMHSDFYERGQDGVSVASLELGWDWDKEMPLATFVARTEPLVAAQLVHPNIARLHNLFQENGTAYLAMENLDGNSLQDILRRDRTIKECEVDEILYPILDALELLHARGLLHLGLQPNAIHIRPDGRPVLTHFGYWFHEEIPPDSDVIHNYSYLPVEYLIKSMADRLGQATADIYGLAATLYRALVGKTATPAIDRYGDRMHAAKNDVRSPGDALDADIDSAARLARPALLRALRHGLALMPEDRPQSIAAFRQILGPPRHGS